MIRLPDPSDSQSAASDGPVPPKTLADLGPGESGEVFDLGGDPGQRLRLMELGFLPGGRVRMVRKAPLGCPVEVDVEGVRWSLRVETARGVRLVAGV